MNFDFYNMDCIEGMKQFPDKYFELDPDYYKAASERLEKAKAQVMFELSEPKPQQIGGLI